MKKTNLIYSIIFLLLVPIFSWGQETYEDNFQAISYSNNDGSLSFATNWVETNETTDPSSGKIQVEGNNLRFRNLDNVAITRTLDLSNFGSGTITLDYDRTSGNETIAVQLFNGYGYQTIGTLNGTGTFSHTLETNEVSAMSAIRFLSGSGNWSSSETVYIDDILFTVFPPDQPPIITGTGDQIYCPGGTRLIAQSITIVDPDNTSAAAAYIQISDGYINGEDVLTLTGTHPSITPSWDAVQGELTLSGPATYVQLEAAILAVEYSSSAVNPTGVRQFSITVGEPNYLPYTGHFYEFVSDPGITWADALLAASNRTYFGLQGYLATLTSQEEADFSGEQAVGFGWIAATDQAVEGEWRWAAGPENGTLFWTGAVAGTEITYANWNGGEPNNCCGGENYAHIAAPSVIRGGASVGAWNDLSNTGAAGGPYSSQGYVVEYGGMTGDPQLSVSFVTKISVSLCRIPTNRRITHRVNPN